MTKQWSCIRWGCLYVCVLSAELRVSAPLICLISLFSTSFFHISRISSISSISCVIPILTFLLWSAKILAFLSFNLFSKSFTFITKKEFFLGNPNSSCQYYSHYKITAINTVAGVHVLMCIGKVALCESRRWFCFHTDVKTDGVMPQSTAFIGFCVNNKVGLVDLQVQPSLAPTAYEKDQRSSLARKAE